MRELLQQVPIQALIDMHPEELGAKLLFLLRRRPGSQQFFVYNLVGELSPEDGQPSSGKYPVADYPAVATAVMEAFAWLEAQGLIVPVWSQFNTNIRTLSRRALKFRNEEEFGRFIQAGQLPRDLLHPDLRDTVWYAFIRGEFDIAVLQAMKAVEIAVREGAGLGLEKIGVALTREAFKPADSAKGTLGGPLTICTDPLAEQEAMASLFAGAIGRYKNPQSHRDVGINSPETAIEIIVLASHLIKIAKSNATLKRTYTSG